MNKDHSNIYDLKNETLSSVMLYQNGVVTIGNSAKTKSQIYPSNYIKSSKHIWEI